MPPRSQRRVAAAVVATCLTYVAAGLVLDQRQSEGPVILVLSPTHGVHSGDLPVLLAWVIGMAACAWIALRD